MHTTRKTSCVPKILTQYVAMITATLSMMNSGLHTGWPSVSLPEYLAPGSSTPMTDNEGSWIVIIALVGAIFGTIFGGLVIDVIGRRRIILLSNIPSFAAWLIIALCSSVPALMIARFITGVVSGAILLALPMYLGEIADSKVRGLIGSGIKISWFVGIILINLMGTFLDVATTAVVLSIAPVLCLVTFYWMPESPYYFLMRGDVEKAKQSLQRFKGTSNVGQELNRLRLSIQDQSGQKGKYLELFSERTNRKAFLIALMAGSVQQFSGIMAIMFYTSAIFEEAGTNFSPNTAALIFYFVQMIASLLSSLIVDRIGRRPLAITSIGGSALALLIEAIYYFLHNSNKVDTSGFSLVPVIVLMIYIVVFSVGMLTIPSLLAAELFATNVKAFALILVNIAISAEAAIVSKVFQFTKDEYGLHVPFFVFSGVCLAGIVLFMCYMPETKGKTLEEIQQSLDGEKTNVEISGQKDETQVKLQY